MKRWAYDFPKGRTFNLENASDQTEGVIVNKAFVEKTGLKDPLDKIVVLHDAKKRILGIIENHVDNFYRSKEPEPFIFYPAARNQYITLLVKAEKSDLGEIQKYLETTWKQLFPTKPFESQFQEDVVLKREQKSKCQSGKNIPFHNRAGRASLGIRNFCFSFAQHCQAHKRNRDTKSLRRVYQRMSLDCSTENL